MKTIHVTVAAMLAIAASSAGTAQESSARTVNANRAALDLPIEARANGTGRVSVKGGAAGDGKFSVAHARIAANRDVVITIDGPTEARILGTARDIGDRRIEVEVRQFRGTNAKGSITLALRNEREIEELHGSGRVGEGQWNVQFRRENESNGTVGNRGANRIVIDLKNRGEGSIGLNEKPQMEVVAAAVLLQKDRDGEIRLDGRETTHIFGRWTEGENRTILFDATRIGDRQASGRIVINRESQDKIGFDGDLRTTSGVYHVRFRSTQ